METPIPPIEPPIPPIEPPILLIEPTIEPPILPIEPTILPIEPEKKPTAEQIEKHFSVMTDSVNLITRLKAEDSLDENEQLILEGNKQHLRLMLTKDFIVEDSRDKSAFVAASK
jgi:hypothetical protein